MKLPTPLTFDWDKGNVEKNWEKHKVHYKESEEVFLNKPLVLYKDKSHSHKEHRFVALGFTNHYRYLFISFTVRGGAKIRIISVRDQSRKERRLYEIEKSN
jgi:uncharacterized protein